MQEMGQARPRAELAQVAEQDAGGNRAQLPSSRSREVFGNKRNLFASGRGYAEST